MRRLGVIPLVCVMALMLFGCQRGAGGQQYLPVGVIGRTTHQIDNVTIWTFLRQFGVRP